MRTRRFPRLLIVASLAWFAGAMAYWRSIVPLIPSCVTHVQGTVDADWTLPGTIVPIFDSTYDQWAGQRKIKCGPLRLLDVATGQVVGTFFDGQDEILGWDTRSLRLACVRRDDQMRIESLTDHQTVSELAGAEEATVAFFPSDEIVMTQAGEPRRNSGVSVYETATGRLLWTRPAVGLGYVRMPGNVGLALVGNFGSDRPREILNLETGEPDGRFGAAAVFSFEASPDGRVAIIEPVPNSERNVHDIATGRLLWTLNVPRELPVEFSRDGSELWVRSIAGQYASKIVRLDSLTGMPLNETNLAAAIAANRWKALWRMDLASNAIAQSADGRFTLEFARRVPPKWLVTFLLKWRRADIHLWLMKTVFDSRLSIVDQKADRLFGVLSDGSGSRFLRHGDAGFSRVYEGRLEYYAMPPQRDWWWLATRGFFPPFGAWLLLFAVPHLSRGQRSGRASLAARRLTSGDGADHQQGVAAFDDGRGQGGFGRIQ